MADFPQELVRKILEYIQDDIEALKATSLISKTWLVASRERLFYHYTLLPTPGDNTIISEIANINNMPEGWQTPIAFVRHLTFSDRRNNGLLPTTAIPPTSPLRDILFPNLTALTFSHMSFIDPGALARIVHLCPRLTELAVQEVIFQRTLAPSSLKPVSGAAPPGRTDCRAAVKSDPPTHLTRLRFRNTATRHLLLALLTPKPSASESSSREGFLPPPPRITQYAISPILQEDLPVLRIFQEYLTPHLVHLAVAYDLSASSTGYWCPPEEHLPDNGHSKPWSLVYGQLRTFYIGNFINGSQPRNPTARLMPNLLTPKKMPKLERVVFELAVRKVGEVDYVDSEGGTAVVWHFIDEILGSDLSMGSGLDGLDEKSGCSRIDRDNINPGGCGEFEFLKEVIFHVTGGADVDGLWSLLVARLPKLRRRGLLRICRSNEYLYPL